jgi:carnosine synthase
MYKLFNSILKAYNLSPIHKAEELVKREEEHPCIAFFDLSGRSIDLLITASQIAPETVFIVSDPSWVLHSNSALYLLQGITVDNSGKFIHVVFEIPQRITCLSNFSQETEINSISCESNIKKFQSYENLAECPISSSANDFPSLENNSSILQYDDCFNAEENADLFIDENLNLKIKLKVFLTRRPNDIVEVSAIASQIFHVDQIVKEGTPKIFSFDYVCDLLQLGTEEKKYLENQISQLGESVFSSIKKLKLSYSNDTEINSQSKQLDFLVADFILREIDSQLRPVFVEIDIHKWSDSFHEYNTRHNSSRNNIFDKWIETMLYRSYRYMLKGKNVVLIGGGGYSKLEASKFAFESGVNIILIDSNKNHPAKEYSSDFLNIDIDDHTKDIDNALEIVKSLHSINRDSIDGVVTFWEDNVPLSSLVAGFLEKKSNSYQSASIAKSKLLTHKKIIIEDCARNSIKSNCYGVESQILRDIEEINNIPSSYYPLVIKVDTGSASFGVEIIRTSEDLLHKFEDYKKYLETSPQYGAGLTFDYKIFVAPYLQGSEHDVDLVMFNGELVGAYLSDNGPTMPNICKEMTAIMPSLLSAEKHDDLIYTAWKACQDVGLTNGVFNVELMHTSLGAKILEINARMGGFYIPTWMFNIWDIDLILYSYIISCGIKPFINKKSLPRLQYNGFLCYTSLHSHLFNLDKLRELSENLNLSVILLEENLPDEEKYEVPYASISVCSQNINQGKYKMNQFLRENHLCREEYEFISAQTDE